MCSTIWSKLKAVHSIEQGNLQKSLALISAAFVSWKVSSLSQSIPPLVWTQQHQRKRRKIRIWWFLFLRFPTNVSPVSISCFPVPSVTSICLQMHSPRNGEWIYLHFQTRADFWNRKRRIKLWITATLPRPESPTKTRLIFRRKTLIKSMLFHPWRFQRATPAVMAMRESQRSVCLFILNLSILFVFFCFPTMNTKISILCVCPHAAMLEFSSIAASTDSSNQSWGSVLPGGWILARYGRGKEQNHCLHDRLPLQVLRLRRRKSSRLERRRGQRLQYAPLPAPTRP